MNTFYPKNTNRFKALPKITILVIFASICFYITGCSSTKPVHISDTMTFYPEGFVDIEPVGELFFVSRYYGGPKESSELFLYDPIKDSFQLLSDYDADNLDHNERNGLLLFFAGGFGNNTIVSYNVKNGLFTPLANGNFPTWYMNTDIFSYVSVRRIIFQDIGGTEISTIEVGEEGERIIGFSLSPDGINAAVGFINYRTSQYALWVLRLDGFSVVDQTLIYKSSNRYYPQKMSWTPNSDSILYLDEDHNNFIGYNVASACYSSPILEDIVSTDDSQYLTGYLFWKGEHVFVTGRYKNQYGVYQIHESDPLLENWLRFENCP